MDEIDFENPETIETLAWAGLGTALAAAGLARRTAGGVVVAAIGGALIYRGIRGSWTGEPPLAIGAVMPHEHGFKVVRSITIDQTPEDLYAFWRNLENLPKVMSHIEEVREIDQTRSRWTARAIGGSTIEWEAIIVDEKEGRSIGWKTVDDAPVPHAGSVWFEPAPGGRGTELTVNLRYDPPGGLAGKGLAKLFHREPGQQVEDDLRKFKQWIEAGEVAVAVSEPTSRKDEQK